MKLESVASCQSVASWVSVPLIANAEPIALKVIAIFTALLLGEVMLGVVTSPGEDVVNNTGSLHGLTP